MFRAIAIIHYIYVVLMTNYGKVWCSWLRREKKRVFFDIPIRVAADFPVKVGVNERERRTLLQYQDGGEMEANMRKSESVLLRREVRETGEAPLLA